MIEELDLGPIEERLKAATPGPWEAYCRDSGGRDGSFLGWEVHGPPDADRGQFEKGVDAQFIANAPTDIAALVAEVKRLREWKDGLVEYLKWKIDLEIEYQIDGFANVRAVRDVLTWVEEE